MVMCEWLLIMLCSTVASKNSGTQMQTGGTGEELIARREFFRCTASPVVRSSERRILPRSRKNHGCDPGNCWAVVENLSVG